MKIRKFNLPHFNKFYSLNREGFGWQVSSTIGVFKAEIIMSVYTYVANEYTFKAHIVDVVSGVEICYYGYLDWKLNGDTTELQKWYEGAVKGLNEMFETYMKKNYLEE